MALCWTNVFLNLLFGWLLRHMRIVTLIQISSTIIVCEYDIRWAKWRLRSSCLQASSVICRSTFHGCRHRQVRCDDYQKWTKSSAKPTSWSLQSYFQDLHTKYRLPPKCNQCVSVQCIWMLCEQSYLLAPIYINFWGIVFSHSEPKRSCCCALHSVADWWVTQLMTSTLCAMTLLLHNNYCVSLSLIRISEASSLGLRIRNSSWNWSHPNQRIVCECSDIRLRFIWMEC